MDVRDEYFEWIFQKILGHRYRNLLRYLFDREFYFDIPMDENRLIDGVDLRYRFADEVGIPVMVIDKKFDNSKCSVLEMMVALSIRIEESIMYDPEYGDRTSVWFWEMIKSLDIDMKDYEYDEYYVASSVSNFLNRNYLPNGKGGLFTIPNTNVDLRNVEIWYQMNLYIDYILGF